ncbi:hypothetical protein OG205_31940 [Lentzea sp. NBC_00516]|uniref:hypothetical protein n=1 Tax=Lentzea sp. NBC_00516 TaxID=2903582 RepID=UPI002E818EEF|nr:hypothetical protein [Lentzea sp. NBC_00516]WUD22669.1 hypothetical protein OG205_31940 [Lentzea sp. NBC_00516]
MSRSLVFVIIAAALGLAACTTAPAPNTAAERPAGTAATTITDQPKNVVNTDTRLGYGSLKLGMTLEDARATGLTDLTWDSEGDGACVGDDAVAISKRYGVVRITLPAEAKTSKGIGIGSTYAAVKKAYPTVSAFRAGWSASIAENAGYSFIGSSETDQFADTDKVVHIKLHTYNADCSMYLL